MGMRAFTFVKTDMWHVFLRQYEGNLEQGQTLPVQALFYKQPVDENGDYMNQAAEKIRVCNVPWIT